MTTLCRSENRHRSSGDRTAGGGVARWIAAWPEMQVRRWGRSLGRMVLRLDRPHRTIVCRNLRFAFPQWSTAQVADCCRRVFENLGITFLEIIQLRCQAAEQIAARIQIDGRENVIDGMTRPSGLILISAHLGNWEMAPLFFSAAFGRSIDLVARNVRPRWFDRWITGFRTRFGNRIIDKQGGLPEMTRSLRSGKALGLLIDQGTKKSEGVKVRFFNRDVSATPAAALLAMRCRCAVYPAFTVRESSGGFRLIVHPQITLQRTRDLRADLVANTQKMVALIEEMVRTYPDQWFWVNKRWKHYHPELYPEHQARRRRRRQRKIKRLAAADAATRRMG